MPSTKVPETTDSSTFPIELTIDAFAPGGDGVGHFEGRAIFVPESLPGEHVRVALPKKRSARGPLQGRLLDVLRPSPERRLPGCPHFGSCGGCQWLCVSPDLQRETKSRAFAQSIIGAQWPDIDLQPIAHGAQDFGYRSRATFHVSQGHLGFSKKGSHEIICLNHCPLLDEKLNVALGQLQELFDGANTNALKLTRGCTDVAIACDETHVSAAFFFERLTSEALDRLNSIVRCTDLKGAIALVKGQAVHVSGRPVLSRPAPCSSHSKLLSRPDLFSQAHVRANELLVAQTLELLRGAKSILELHGGSGNFTLPLAERVEKIISIELCAPALELARQSAREARFSNLRFVLGDAIRQAHSLVRSAERFDALLLDPPRAGAPGIAELAQKSAVRRVVYVSCNPLTLARDAQALSAVGYFPRFARPFDLFPQTIHLEGVMAFERA